jgi:hypothetical protein
VQDAKKSGENNISALSEESALIDMVILLFLPVITFWLLWKLRPGRIWLSIIPLILAIFLAIVSPAVTRLIPIPVLTWVGGLFIFGGIAMAVLVPYPFLMDSFATRRREPVIFAGTILTYLVIVIPGFGCALGVCSPTILASFVDTLHLTGDAVKTSQFLIQFLTALVTATGVFGLLLLGETLWNDIKKRQILSILLVPILVILFFFDGASLLIGLFVVSLFALFNTIGRGTVKTAVILLLILPLVIGDAYSSSLLSPGSSIDGSLNSVLFFGFAILLSLVIRTPEMKAKKSEEAVMIVSVFTATASSVIINLVYSPGISLSRAFGAAFDLGYPSPGMPFPDGVCYLTVCMVITFITGVLVVLGYNTVNRSIPGAPDEGPLA